MLVGRPAHSQRACLANTRLVDCAFGCVGVETVVKSGRRAMTKTRKAMAPGDRRPGIEPGRHPRGRANTDGTCRADILLARHDLTGLSTCCAI
jgi:hypothetical protein